LAEERDEFDFTSLKKWWDDFSRQIRKKGRESDFTALNGELELIEQEKIKLIIANKFQQIAIENLRQDLLGYLRKNLKNQFIDLVVEIKKKEEKELRYTNREKFEYLVDKYPKLKDLKDRLDLDPEF